MVDRPELKRVVVTGMGALGPNGLAVPEIWTNLLAGQSGITELPDHFNPNVYIGGQVSGFNPDLYFSSKGKNKIHRSAQLSYAGTLSAMQDAGLVREWQAGDNPDEEALPPAEKKDLEDKYRDMTTRYSLVGLNPEEFAVFVGSGVAGAPYIPTVHDDIREKGFDRVSAYALLQFLPERVATVPGMKLNAQGEVASIVIACSTGQQNLTHAYDQVRLGYHTVVAAGGAEAPLEPIGINSFDKIRALSRRNDPPKLASRPFDARADGFVMSEGVGVVVLEELEHAKARNARIYAEVLGYGNTSDAFHDTKPSGKGAVRAMNLALSRAGIRADQLGYVNAHGTSTPTGDGKELDAVRTVLGAASLEVPVSSTKSMSGHLLGAAGGLESIVTIMALYTGDIPPTINLHSPIREGMNLVPNQAQQHRDIMYAMTNAFAFGGACSSLVVGRYIP